MNISTAASDALQALKEKITGIGQRIETAVGEGDAKGVTALRDQREELEHDEWNAEIAAQEEVIANLAARLKDNNDRFVQPVEDAQAAMEELRQAKKKADAANAVCSNLKEEQSSLYRQTHTAGIRLKELKDKQQERLRWLAGEAARSNPLPNSLKSDRQLSPTS